ncbi:MAG: sigma-70 family RNA polymerase sigma factor [Paludisphaera borealis]|uniref:RNA polymerase sigma factor n=1 Tax=Paludisphaera borealis TaxID=1387353 RepID=UPI00284F04ED|nr:sigma-70 family RNA polymerase sigma factor [Paludisphaera borealis]MDR3619068.1 sigma-70 family RNA polymerase sigma factor [Paludisphaera borealis]
MGRISGNVIGELTRVLRWGTATGDDDDRLLERFLANHDESAFTALVARHGPMVLGVCRRVLRDEHDVEDAFQATFLVLVRSAGAIRRGELVGPWLHGVAQRVAVRTRAGAARRFVRERSGSDVESLALAPAARDQSHAELRTILDAELARLPEALRAPLVLCYLEGLTHEQAAGRLRQPVGTIRSRLSRGRDRLRTRLARRGVSADDAAWGTIVLAEPISPALFETTVRSALEFTVHHNTATALVSATTAALAKGVLDAMLITKLKLAGACALGLILTMGGVSGYALQQGPGEKKAEPTPAIETPQDTSKSRVASEVRELKSTILKSELELAELKRRREELENQITDVESVVARKRKVLADVLQNADNPQAAPAQQPTGNENAAAVKPASAAQPSAGALGMMQGMQADKWPKWDYLASQRIVIVASPDGHVVKGYSSETGDSKSIRLAENGDPDLKVMPVVSATFAALAIKGPMIKRIAAFNSIDGRWYAQDLIAPATSVSPVVGPAMCYYTIDHRIYAFSGPAGRWDALEIPVDGKPVMRLEPEYLSCQIGDHLHLFSVKIGKWADIDTRAVSDEPKKEQGGAQRPTHPTGDRPGQAPDQDAVVDGTKQPEYLDPFKPIIVPSPRGDIVTIFGVSDRMMMNVALGDVVGSDGKPFPDPQSVRLAATGDPRLEVDAVFDPSSDLIIPLILRGEKIQRLAIFNKQHGRWDVQELREPVKEATPVISGRMTVYALGRRLYTYSVAAGKWSVLELPEGATPQAKTNDQALTLRYGDKAYAYNVESGEWTVFDLRTEPEESKRPK